ncbi:MAG TPA: hypothetical protein DCO79_07670 [Spirochaeta sp.]|nr:hypothetical protein [Spirochaeta sp.]
MVLLYDGSLAGFFSAVFEAYRLKQSKTLIRNEKAYLPELFSETRTIKTQPDEARRVLEGITEKLGKRGLNLITRAFLAEQKGCEDAVYRFIRKGLKTGRQIIDELTDPDALAVMKMSQKTDREYHRFLGLIRFRKLSTGEYYAAFEPGTNLIPLLGRHFASRFSDQAWMIHDKKRNTALVHIEGGLEIIGLEDSFILPEDADPWIKIWKIYHQKIGIEERSNPKLQMNFMPKKHWNYLPEVD